MPKHTNKGTRRGNSGKKNEKKNGAKKGKGKLSNFGGKKARPFKKKGK